MVAVVAVVAVVVVVVVVVAVVVVVVVVMVVVMVMVMVVVAAAAEETIGSIVVWRQVILHFRSGVVFALRCTKKLSSDSLCVARVTVQYDECTQSDSDSKSLFFDKRLAGFAHRELSRLWTRRKSPDTYPFYWTLGVAALSETYVVSCIQLIGQYLGSREVVWLERLLNKQMIELRSEAICALIQDIVYSGPNVRLYNKRDCLVRYAAQPSTHSIEVVSTSESL